MSLPRFSLSLFPRRSSDVHCEKGGTASINGLAGKVCPVREFDPVVRWSFRGITGAKNGRSIKRLPAFLWLLSLDTSRTKNRGFGFVYRSRSICPWRIRGVCMVEDVGLLHGIRYTDEIPSFVFCLLMIDTNYMQQSS